MKKLLVAMSVFMIAVSFLLAGCGGETTTSGVFTMSKITSSKGVTQDVRDAIGALNKSNYTMRLTEDGILTHIYYDTEARHAKSLNAAYRIKGGKVQYWVSNTWSDYAKITRNKITYEFKIDGKVIYVAEYTKK